MTIPVRFAYAEAAAGRTDGGRLAYLPITLRYATHVLTVAGLLDTGSTVNVLPYPIGLQLGLVWEQQTTRVQLTGNLARLPARGVLVSGPSSLVSAGGFGVCLDAIIRRANNLGPSKLFHGI
jgi:hypothetical protein